MDQEKILKYILGESPDNEQKEVLEWVHESDENRREFARIKNAWALSSGKKELTQERIAVAYDNLKRKRSFHHRPITKALNNVMKYAAILIIVFGLGMLFRQYKMERDFMKVAATSTCEFQAPWGQMANLKLPDGTSVMLNSGTTISYSGNFAGNERIVELDGEAFFDVITNQEKPFVVKTRSLDLRVYGTSFNVLAYHDDSDIETTLVEGSLGIETKAGTELVRLVPGENASFNTIDNKLAVKKVQTDLYSSWKSGIITFRNEKLKDIARKIERWYNVEIVIRNEELGDMLYSGTILKNKPIDQILEVLKITASVKYTIKTYVDKPSLIYWDK